MKKSVKILCAVLALVLALGCGVGGTLAYLAKKTAPVTNTFAYGNIDLTLVETHKDGFLIVPGTDQDKDPIVTVLEGSEPCWLFVKVDAKDMEEVTYALTMDASESGWTKGDGSKIPANVYYRAVNAKAEAQAFHLLVGDRVSYSEALTKTQIDNAIEANKAPTLTFTAYAVQSTNLDVNAAWAEAAGLK